VVATPVVVGNSAAVVGGGIIWEPEGDNDVNPNAFSAPMAVAFVEPTVDNLIRDIQNSVSPLGTVRDRMDDGKWRSLVFDPLTPQQYARVIKSVTIEFDQPDMAALMATSVRGGRYTHEYVVAALRSVSDWIRTSMLSKLLPLCADLKTSANVIKSELTEWELVCSQRYFDESLDR